MEKITVQQGRKDVKAPVQMQQKPGAAKAPVKTEEKKMEESKTEIKSEVKKEEVKTVKSVITKKEEAVARGVALPISKKHSMYIGSFIKGKTIDASIAMLQDVIKFKRAVPFKGEIPHRKGKGMMSGRYPITASAAFISMLKALKGNVIVNGMDLDKTRIFTVSPSWAHRPQMKGGGRFKRTHVVITAREIKDSKSEKKQENKK